MLVRVWFTTELSALTQKQPSRIVLWNSCSENYLQENFLFRKASSFSKQGLHHEYFHGNDIETSRTNIL